MCKTTRLALLLLLLACPGVARAAWSNDPAVNTPVTPIGTDAWYDNSRIASDGAGGLFVSWTQTSTSGTNGLDLRLQHIDARGVRLWPTDYGISVPGDQVTPELLPDGEGGVFLVWRNVSFDYHGLGMQRVTSGGAGLWGAEGKVLADGMSFASEAVLTPDGAGGFYCVWTNGVKHDLYAQRVNPSGDRMWPDTGAVVCSDPASQTNAQIASTTNGELVAVWLDAREQNPYSMTHLYTQRLDRQGVARWAAEGVDLGTALVIALPKVFGDSEDGVVFSWMEYVPGVGNSVRAQRLGVDASPRWGANGVELGAARYNASDYGAALGPAQQFYVCWGDTVAGQYLTRAQRVDASGAAQWTAGGTILRSSPAFWRLPSAVVPLADGGCWLALFDFADPMALYAQRLTAGGTPTSASPTIVCSSPGPRELAHALSDGGSGLLMEWIDRGTNVKPRAQHVDRWGQLGVQPNLTQVIDAPNDQGGYVQASWTKSPLDTPPSAGVNKYRFWREVPVLGAQAPATRGARMIREGDDLPEDGAPALLQLASATGGSEYWEYVGEMLADGRALYSASIATACDSVPGSNPATRFLIEGRRGDGTQWWFSDPLSGTSADNLAPASPASFFAVWSAGQSKLHWPKTLESDFKEYRIYAGDWPNFTPSASNLVATVTDTGWTHVTVHPIGYKIVVVDIHGNASPARWTAPSGTTEVGDALPSAFAFAPVTPNPMRGDATLRFALPSPAQVTLAVYDAQGRRVRLLADATLPAGEHVMRWEGDDDAGRALAAGLYFARLEADGRRFVNRIVRVR